MHSYVLHTLDFLAAAVENWRSDLKMRNPKRGFMSSLNVNGFRLALVQLDPDLQLLSKASGRVGSTAKSICTILNRL